MHRLLEKEIREGSGGSAGTRARLQGLASVASDKLTERKCSAPELCGFYPLSPRSIKMQTMLKTQTRYLLIP